MRIKSVGDKGLSSCVSENMRAERFIIPGDSPFMFDRCWSSSEIKSRLESLTLTRYQEWTLILTTFWIVHGW